MRIAFLANVLLIGLNLVRESHAAEGLPLWTNRYSGPGDDRSAAIAVDTHGDIAVTGYSRFNGGSSLDYVTIKYSNSGLPLWTNYFDGSGNDVGVAMTMDATGNVIITAISEGSGTADDYATIKYSSAGVPLWTNRYVGPGYYDQPRAVAVDNSGTVFVTGSSDKETPHQREFLTIAYSAAGVPLWTNRYNGHDGADAAVAMALDRNGNVFVTGFSPYFHSESEFATIKYSGEGTPIWTNQYAETSSEAKAIALDDNGDVLVTGMSYGDTYNTTTIKYSNAGLALWTNRYHEGGSWAHEPVAVRTDSARNVFVTGYSFSETGEKYQATLAYSSGGVPLWTNRYGPLNNEGGPAGLAVDKAGNVIIAGSSPSTNSFPDYLTIKYSNSGVPLWTNRYDGPVSGYDLCAGLVVDGCGNVFVTGGSSGASDYDYVTIKLSSGPMQPPHLDFQVSDGRLLLSWTNQQFNLQFAASPDGIFTNLFGVVSPFTNEFPRQVGYFRLKATSCD